MTDTAEQTDYLTSWNAGAHYALQELRPLHPPTKPAKGAYQEAADLSLHYFNQPRNVDHKIIHPIITLGKHAFAELVVMERKEILFPNEAADNMYSWVHRTLVSKQHDYGHNNILVAGMRGLALRQSDKVARYYNLKDKLALNEPFKDCLLDMVGYAAIGIMLRDDTFKRELLADPF